MPAEQFQNRLRSFLQREPFQPFIVELEEGEAIVVDDPDALAMGGGAAGYIGPKDVYFFNHEQVRSIHLAAQEAAS